MNWFSVSGLILILVGLFMARLRATIKEEGTLGIEVAGAGSVVVPLGFRPRSAEAEFVTAPSMPACSIGHENTVSVRIKHHAIEIDWVVTGPCTIKWKAARKV
jgi:hypothetical protein